MVDAWTLEDGRQAPDTIAERLAAWLAGARRSLDLALYDVRLPGPVGDRVAAALKEAMGRGVAVRIAYNDEDPGPDERPFQPPPPRTEPGVLEQLGARLCGIPGWRDLMHHKFAVSGGPDLDPAGYEAEQDPNLGPIEPALDAFEFAVARRADELGMPILGICRGCQTLHVARGGTLHQHLPDVTDGSIDHRQAVSGRRPTHAIEIERDSRLAAIVGGEPLHVNSFHHQAVDRLGRGLRVVARATDGVVEGIEQTGDRVYLGVQWHVETLVEHPRHARLFETLVAEAAMYARAVTGQAA